jgi:hypothetical protein
VLRAGALPAARVRNAARTQSRYVFVDLTTLDSLLASETSAASGTSTATEHNGPGAGAEGRAGRLHAARSLVVGGVIAGLLVAGAMAGVIAMVADLVGAIART